MGSDDPTGLTQEQLSLVEQSEKEIGITKSGNSFLAFVKVNLGRCATREEARDRRDHFQKRCEELVFTDQCNQRIQSLIEILNESERLALMVKLYEVGLSARQVSDIFDCLTTNVYNDLHKALPKGLRIGSFKGNIVALQPQIKKACADVLASRDSRVKELSQFFK